MTTATAAPPETAASAPAAAAAKPQAPVSHTSAAKYTVSVTLEPHVHKYFADKAEADDRTLANFLARFLRTHVDQLKKQDENF
jgi:hypothetical protein